MSPYDFRRLPRGGDRCRCSGCGAHFTSTTAFMEHRIGRHGVDRGCLGLGDMLLRGQRVRTDGYITTSKPSRFTSARSQGAAIGSEATPW